MPWLTVIAEEILEDTQGDRERLESAIRSIENIAVGCHSVGGRKLKELGTALKNERAKKLAEEKEEEEEEAERKAQQKPVDETRLIEEEQGRAKLPAIEDQKRAQMKGTALKFTRSNTQVVFIWLCDAGVI